MESLLRAYYTLIQEEVNEDKKRILIHKLITLYDKENISFSSEDPQLDTIITFIDSERNRI